MPKGPTIGRGESAWVLPLAVACILHVSVTTPHPEGVRDMTQKWAESQVGELSRRAQAGAAARGQLEPGTFMLTMIVKNEARRLASSLPAWAPIVDFWVIGVDRNNTDDTENVIKTHLAGVPGEILIVDFDGMGPTWTKVVEHGLKKYPQATHGILADADFTPLPQTLSKWDLDTGCSKLQFTVLEADGTGTRVMDWIYRNIPGVRVERRTHQILLVPRTSNQPTYQRQIGFTVKEFAGGYQDRAGNKSGRYIDWLLKDLEEMPGDSRTIYYLAKEHMELIGPNPVADLRAVPPGPGAYHLRKSLEYYQMRARIGSLLGEGVDEECYWAMLKAAEICERWLHDAACSLDYWGQAWRLDPPRADAPFYIGQHYRLRRDGASAVKALRKVAKMSMPQRTNYQWPYLYECLRHLELVRAGSHMTHDFYLSSGAWKDIQASYSTAMQNCPPEDKDGLPHVFAQVKARREKSKREKAKKRAAESPPTASPSSPSGNRGDAGTVTRAGQDTQEPVERPKMVDEFGNLVDIPDEEETVRDTGRRKMGAGRDREGGKKRSEF